MKRTIIKIDEGLCDGCGICVEGCHEGALQLINDKAVIVSDLYCDGLGACIPDCPRGAISLEEREAEPYNEEAVMERVVPKGERVILAHLTHLKDHGELEFMQQGIDFLKKHNIKVDLSSLEAPEQPQAGHQPYVFQPASRPAQAPQFPVQLHLINPMNSLFSGAHLLVAADCSAFIIPDFHRRFLKDKVLAIACPKLDRNLDTYVAKLTTLIDTAKIETLTVLQMAVPCCSGLMKLVSMAREKAQRYIPVKRIVLNLQGEIQSEEWIQ
ncbi:MAG: 4Fe-4S ferredoxin [Bacteroidales bacterium]|nr:4Fe-4S ferredoxin [Bacteroidales bacterium]